MSPGGLGTPSTRGVHRCNGTVHLTPSVPRRDEVRGNSFITTGRRSSHYSTVGVADPTTSSSRRRKLDSSTRSSPPGSVSDSNYYSRTDEDGTLAEKIVFQNLWKQGPEGTPAGSKQCRRDTRPSRDGVGGKEGKGESPQRMVTPHP